jgi:hypothetical protein
MRVNNPDVARISPSQQVAPGRIALEGAWANASRADRDFALRSVARNSSDPAVKAKLEELFSSDQALGLAQARLANTQRDAAAKARFASSRANLIAVYQAQTDVMAALERSLTDAGARDDLLGALEAISNPVSYA